MKYKRYDIRESKWKIEFGKIREEKLRLKYPPKPRSNSSMSIEEDLP